MDPGWLSPIQKHKQLFARAVPVAALLIFFSLALQTINAKTPTADEGMHMLRGRVLWQSGLEPVHDEHPPLSHRLIGLFFTIESSLPDVTKLPSWITLSRDDLVNEFLWLSGAVVARVTFLGRLPIVYSVVLLGALLALWSEQRTGLLGLSMVMTLFAFSPNLLASSTLATTDAIAAVTFVACVLFLWFYWQRPSFWRWLLAATALGLALGAKMTGLLLLPVTFILCYSHWRGRQWWQPGLIWLSLLPIAGLVVWAIYGFEFGTAPGLPIPIPAPTYFTNFIRAQSHIDRGHFAYLLGEWSNSGWWHYFAVAFLVKTPAITLVLLIGTVVYLTWRRQWRQTLYLWLPALALFAVASYSRLNIGYRHILPIIPLIWLLIAETAPFWRERRAFLPLLVAALALYAVIGFLQRPDYLAYFNEFIGGSENGHLYLGDSNIDWGQDLQPLADYVNDYQKDELFVSYFGASDPTYYGITQPPLFDVDGKPINFAPANPAAGRYAISVNHLHAATVSEPDLFDAFRDLEPIGRIGYSILLFDIVEPKSGQWVAQCLDPVPPIDEAEAAAIVGYESLRHVVFDCHTSWVFPAGEGPGWFVLPLELEPDLIKKHFPDRLTEVYSNANSRSSKYSIYYWSGLDDPSTYLSTISSPVTMTDGSTLELPLQVGDIASFLGGLSDGSVWSSFWQVASATERSWSVLMHLYTGELAPVVADGLGYQVVQWQPGDVFIQYYDFQEPAGEFLETGIYDFTTLERLPIGSNGNLGSSVRVQRIE
jgi:hypothetical protein